MLALLTWLAVLLLPFTLSLPMIASAPHPLVLSSITLIPPGPDQLYVQADMDPGAALIVELYPPGIDQRFGNDHYIVLPSEQALQGVTVAVPGLSPDLRPLLVQAYGINHVNPRFSPTCLTTTYMAPTLDLTTGYYPVAIPALDQPLGTGLTVALPPRLGPPCN
jgi:hypothetical protein